MSKCFAFKIFFFQFDVYYFVSWAVWSIAELKLILEDIAACWDGGSNRMCWWPIVCVHALILRINFHATYVVEYSDFLNMHDLCGAVGIRNKMFREIEVIGTICD